MVSPFSYCVLASELWNLKVAKEFPLYFMEILGIHCGGLYVDLRNEKANPLPTASLMLFLKSIFLTSSMHYPYNLRGADAILLVGDTMTHYSLKFSKNKTFLIFI